jgi:SAM-dependent methyltransferase
VTGHRPTVSAADFYDSIADAYDEEFDAPHRRMYDDLAWERVEPLVRDSTTIVDVGCGTGRWSTRLVGPDRQVTGIEPSGGMAAQARARGLSDFTLLETTVDEARVDVGSADLVLAMGSVQYSPDPIRSIARMASWLRPGGHLAMLTDSLVALVMELIAAGDISQATDRARTRMARWVRGGRVVEYHLLDAARLRAAFVSAGLADVSVDGLLVSWTALGRDGWCASAERDPAGTAALERELAQVEALADTGKQLLAIGRKP